MLVREEVAEGVEEKLHWELAEGVDDKEEQEEGAENEMVVVGAELLVAAEYNQLAAFGLLAPGTILVSQEAFVLAQCHFPQTDGMVR